MLVSEMIELLSTYNPHMQINILRPGTPQSVIASIKSIQSAKFTDDTGNTRISIVILGDEATPEQTEPNHTDMVNDVRAELRSRAENEKGQNEQ